jgi:hypothetical protein
MHSTTVKTIAPGVPSLTQVSEASRETALVLAACHSLVVVEDGPQGGDKKPKTDDAGGDDGMLC